MNKLLFVALIAITTLSFSSCGTYKSSRDSKNAVSSSMIGKIGTILIQDLGTKVLSNSGSNMLTKLNMGTKINSIIKGASMVSSFKNMLSSNYGISSDKVNNAYSSFGNLKDVASFIGKNASSSFLSKL